MNISAETQKLLIGYLSQFPVHLQVCVEHDVYTWEAEGAVLAKATVKRDGWESDDDIARIMAGEQVHHDDNIEATLTCYGVAVPVITGPFVMLAISSSELLPARQLFSPEAVPHLMQYAPRSRSLARCLGAFAS